MIDSPARANNRGLYVFRVDICLHVCKKEMETSTRQS
jgi:hypothetical protein